VDDAIAGSFAGQIVDEFAHSTRCDDLAGRHRSRTVYV
jgi:hypothetical protein